MRLQAVARADLAAVWPQVEPWLAAACARPDCDLAPSDLLDLVDRGAALLVLVVEGAQPVAAGVTQVRDRAGGDRACWILALGGTGARAWRHTLAEIEAGAARVGCARIEFVGRPGWERLLPDYGARACEAGTHYAKDIA